MTKPMPVRRTVALVLSGALLLAASGCAAQPEESGPVTIRFTWWGGDLRNQMTLDVIEAFEAEHPDITVQPEPGPFDGYFDKLSTQMAAGDAPDVIQMPDSFFAEYVGRGALLPLDDLDIDHADIPDNVWNTGVVDDQLWGVPSGVNTSAMVANPALFEQAGIPLPDDDTWTWDDYAQLATELSAALPDGYYGSQAPGTDQNTLAVWVRQLGDQLFSDDGLGFDEESAASFFEFIEGMRDSGAIPDASQVSEQMGLNLEQSGTATGNYAIGFWASNQLKNLEVAAGQDLELLKFPSVEGDAEQAQLSIATGWYVSSAKTEHPEAVATFLDYLINSPEAGAITLTERGVPANTSVAESIAPSLDAADQESMAFLDEVSAIALNPPPPPPPTGAGSFQDTLRRIVTEVMFERLTADEAAAQLIQEMESVIS